MSSKSLSQKYHYWRWRNFIGMFAGYLNYYFVRKSLSPIKPYLISSLGFSKAQVGLIVSSLSLGYGLSKFIAGVIADHISPRYMMALGLVLSGLCNIFFSQSTQLWLFVSLWTLNGVAQGLGWPPCAKILTAWYSKQERGRWWSVCASTRNLGGAIVAIFFAAIVLHWGWRPSMRYLGLEAIIAGLLLSFVLRSKPQDLDMPDVEQLANRQREAIKPKLGFKAGLIAILSNRSLWWLSLASFFIAFVRSSFDEWIGLYLQQAQSYEYLQAFRAGAWFDMGGLVGSIMAGIISDKLFQGKRVGTMLFYAALALLSLLIFKYTQSMYLVPIIGFFVFGPELLTTIAAAEIGGVAAAGAAIGLQGFIGYLGSAVGGYPVGKIIDLYGWNSYLFLVIGFTALSFAALLPIRRTKI